MMKQAETSSRTRRSDPRRGVRRWLGAIGGIVVVLRVATACGVDEAGTLPPDVQDPATLKTPSGAVARYRGVLAALPSAVDGAILTGGLLTDEMAALPISLGTSGPYTLLDSRQDPAFSPARLHRLRAQAREARGFLAAYASDSSTALRGHLFALEGYAEVFLADLFCSGIPLSTVDFDGNYTLAAGSTTAEVYDHAIALFDSAVALTSDSLRFQHLAAVGLGRARLARGDYAAAAEAVAAVPNDFQYQTALKFVFTGSFVPDSALLFWFATRPSSVQRSGAPSMGNREGVIGLDYRTSGDPRTTPWSETRTDPPGNRMYIPAKYTAGGTGGLPSSPVTLTVANGIEARLIEAEALLQSSPNDAGWLDKLNALRQIVGLADTTDPGTTDARVDLLFRERAFWLYLTAHRQGDLRRLIRQYQRSVEATYPRGDYPGGSGKYGNGVVVPVPDDERTLNPKYAGCLHLNA